MGFLTAGLPFSARLDLPPSPRLPAALQTLALRRWPLPFLQLCRRRIGPRFTLHLVDMAPLVFLSDPHEIAAMLVAPPTVLRPGEGTELIASLIGEHSFLLSDENERNHVRGAVAPAFRGTHERAYAETIAATVRDEIGSWQVDGTIALYPLLSRLTLRVVLDVLFGETPAAFGLGERVLEMLSVARSFVIQAPRLRTLPGWHRAWRRFQQQRCDLDAMLSVIISSREQAHSTHTDVLAMLMSVRRQGARLPQREIADNLLSLVVAGHETTASVLGWAFQLLAHNPDVQHRLAGEISNGAGEAYLTATVLETLRLGPVFLFAIPRVVASMIEIGGIAYRPPAQLLACTYLMHNDPALFPEPDTFRPERFLDTPPSPLIWRPWGGGRRRCLGQHLAMLEMQIVLREVLAKHEVWPARPTIERARWRTAIVAPHAGAQVILRAR
jgi:cytochrome P450